MSDATWEAGERLLISSGLTPEQARAATEDERTRDSATPRKSKPETIFPRFELRSYADIVRENVELLLLDEPPIPIGALALLAGMQGLGKSLWADRLAARVTLAGHGVIMIGDEDAAAAVTKPRLEAAGADLGRVFEMHAPEDPYLGVRLPRDGAALSRLVTESSARLVVIDPWTNHLDGVNPNRGEEVRAALSSILAAARALRFTLLVVAHLNKSSDGDPLQRIAHSGAISQLARAAFLMGRDPEHEGDDDPGSTSNPFRVLAHVKANLTDIAPSRRCRIETVELPARGLEPLVVTARLREDGFTSTSAEDMLSSDPAEAPAQRGALDLLRQMTADGPAPVEEVRRAARNLGISERSLQRAASRFKYRTRLSGGVGSPHVYVSPPRDRPGEAGDTGEAGETSARLATVSPPSRHQADPHFSTVSPASPVSPPPSRVRESERQGMGPYDVDAPS